ncbi:MAG TPA: molybdopterin-guanine dinucleotide biosynthesis protein B [Spirochaetia bacterium]|jgi:molybdopterin-guanine dinucleotide biosynthesis protein MobB|nr:molybdopterin-guanine dinucleotide biosynthesis protein B [Spirochaetia bacterium]
MAHGDPGSGWVFHPYEIALVGYQNSGKTTLASKLVGTLGLNLAYVKRDAHRFDMDKPGKDTHTLAAAGARSVFISDPQHRALVRHQPLDPLLSRLDFLEEDAALVEGHKQSSVAKIVVLDPELTITADPAFRAQAPLAAVGPWAERPNLPWPIPYFCRDDVPAVGAFIRGYWDSLTEGRPILGLVLTGGKSTRMGTDKAVLDYGQGEQTARVFHLLEEFCEQVFVSCRSDQADLPGRRGLPQVHDTLLGKGPLSGILSAFELRPDATWLVVACDLPRLDRRVLETLVAGRHPFRFATAFRGHQDFPEPLCALYEPKARPRLYQFLAAGYDCPRKMLINSPVEVLDPPEGDRLANVNTPEERHALGF